MTVQDLEKIKEAAKLLKKAVGESAKVLRKRAGFPSADAACDAVGVSAVSIYEVESGKNWISAEMLLRLSEAYGVPKAMFFAVDGALESLPKPTLQEALKVIGDQVGMDAVPKAKPRPGSVEDLRAKIIARLPAEDDLKRLNTVLSLLGGDPNALNALNSLLKDEDSVKGQK